MTSKRCPNGCLYFQGGASWAPLQPQYDFYPKKCSQRAPKSTPRGSKGHPKRSRRAPRKLTFAPPVSKRASNAARTIVSCSKRRSPNDSQTLSLYPGWAPWSTPGAPIRSSKHKKATVKMHYGPADCAKRLQLITYLINSLYSPIPLRALTIDPLPSP